MSHGRDIDNAPSSCLQAPHKAASTDSLPSASRFPSSRSMSCDNLDHTLALRAPTESFIVSLPSSSQAMQFPGTPGSSDAANAKGKGVSRPLDIGARVIDDAHSDIFAMSFDPPYIPEAGTSSSPPDSGNMTTHHAEEDHRDDLTAALVFDGVEEDISESFMDKGKGKLDVPPTLPPLTFSPTHFDYDEMCRSPTLSSSEPGPSSFGSGYTMAMGRDPASIEIEHRTHEEIPVLTRIPSRRRSFSNLSIHSTHSLAASMSRIKVKLGTSKRAGALARKLFAKDCDTRHSPSAPSSPGPTPVEGVPTREFDGPSGCFAPWRRDVRSRPREANDAGPYGHLNIDGLVENNSEGAFIYYPLYSGARTASEFSPLKGKGRSNSDPFPLPAAFDVVPPTMGDIFTPLPTIVPRNSFDDSLPRELQLQILGCLVQIHDEDHARREQDVRWTAIKASKHRWVGRDQGVRELVRLSRVSKTWLALVFDGQLWTRLNLRSFPKIPASQILHITASSGTFITSIDLAGHGRLLASTLETLTANLCTPWAILPGLPSTRLTSINLSSCSAVTTTALHHLLRRSPALQTLHVKGLNAVTNETCELIYEFCPRLTSLDMSRCKNLTGAGIRTLASCTVKDGQSLALKELRLSGMRGISDSVMHALGKAAPYLEVLELSHCRDLHNSSLDSFVSCDDDYEPLDSEVVVLSAREAGRDPNEGRRYRRRVTRLRHLSLSSCVLLTDIACAHLAHTMPQLEFLELGGIGGDLKDNGLVVLLETLQNLRKLDLEDASDITDTVLRAITPPPLAEDPGRGPRPGPTPGHALEHLIVSYAAQLSNEAFLALIRNCLKLRVLEADSTRMSGVVVKEFAARVREREVLDARVIAVDCRAVGDGTVKELVGATRPRQGWRAYEARRLAYFDGRDDEGLSIGQDECDPRRVVLKTFYSWQTVDAVASARQKRRKGRRDAGGSGSSGVEDSVGRGRWWSPGGRRSPSTASPSLLDLGNNDRDGCTIM